MRDSVQTAGVQPLATLTGCELAEDSIDVRGWEVTTPAFSPVGVVSDLLVDVSAGRVRYLDVSLPDGRRMLLPIGKARVDDALDRVVVTIPSCLDSLVEYDAGDPSAFDREYERRVLESHGEVAGDGEDFYACPAFDDSAFSHQRRGEGRRAEDHEAHEHDTRRGEEPVIADAAGTEIRVVPTDDDES